MKWDINIWFGVEHFHDNSIWQLSFWSQMASTAIVSTPFQEVNWGAFTFVELGLDWIGLSQEGSVTYFMDSVAMI